MAPFYLSLFAFSVILLAPGSYAQGNGKRGLTYGNATWANRFETYPQVTWGYNWGMERDGLSDTLEYVPMLWGAPTEPDPAWDEAASKAEHVLGFNEPDLTGQAEVDPSVAATSWENFVNPLNGKVKIGAPAVTNAGHGTLNYMGLGWLDGFMDICNGCQYDFIPVHWYANESAAAFQEYVTLVHDKYDKPIWVTEFMKEDTEEGQIAFLEDVMPWMDSTPWVERYSYFGVFELFLLKAGGDELSELGKTYATYTG